MAKEFNSSYGKMGGGEYGKKEKHPTGKQQLAHEKKEKMADKMYKMLKDPKHLQNVAKGKAKEAYEKKHSVLD